MHINLHVCVCVYIYNLIYNCFSFCIRKLLTQMHTHTYTYTDLFCFCLMFEQVPQFCSINFKVDVPWKFLIIPHVSKDNF